MVYCGQATTDGRLWALDRTAFRNLLVGYNIKKREMYETCLEHVPLLGTHALSPCRRFVGGPPWSLSCPALDPVLCVAVVQSI